MKELKRKEERNEVERGKKKSHKNDQMKRIFLTSDIMISPISFNNLINKYI
jgi:hypothetical protein